MEFIISNKNIENQCTDCIIIGIFKINRLSKTAKKLDKISNGYISDILNNGSLKGEIGQTLLLHHVPNILSKQVLLVGCGIEETLNVYKYKQIIKNTINAINNICITEAISFLIELQVRQCNTYWKIRQTIETSQETIYKFKKFKTNKCEQHTTLSKLILNVSIEKNELINSQYAIKHGIAISNGIKIAKDISNMPPNICNPAYLASLSHKLANKFKQKINTHILGKQEMKDLKMNAYLAVSSGSQNEPIMSVIEYDFNPDIKKQPIVLIGKGLTFDSGGISVKPADHMDEMKYDMCGAASVYGIMHIAAELELPLNIIGILAGCENMIDGRSMRPGDILTTMSGKTVEVLNTDAEGRLVLCDVMTYVERFNPQVVIDIATLTGACVIALGQNMSGLMSNNDSLANELINASKESYDLAWCLPMTDEYQEELNSCFADVANIGKHKAGAITAACFLSRFASNYIWAHLDIAGTAWKSGKDKGATGRPIAMMSQFLLNRSKFKINENLEI